MKANIAVFFSILFMCLIAGPSILVAVKDNASNCIILDSNSEETKGNESIKILDVEVLQVQDNYLASRIYSQNASTHFYSGHYTSFSLSQNYPPPEALS